MPARSIWSGTISFGLVSVPVRMHAPTASKELRFHFVAKDELQPVAYDEVRKDTGEHVDPDDIVRAFEVEKGRYVPVGEEDVGRLDVELTHSIDICDFVGLGEIDPIFYRQGYYLAPQEGAEKPYALLVRALEETGIDLIRAKDEGKELPEPEAEDEGEVVDLMAALRESVGRTKKQKQKPRGRRPARQAS